jgi:hypothetical protein
MAGDADTRRSLLDEAIPLGVLAVYVTAEYANVGEPVKALGLPSTWVAATGLAVIAIVIGMGRGTVRPRWSWVFGAAAAFVWARALSAVFAVDPSVSTEPMAQLFKDALTVVIVVTLASSCGTRLWRVAVPIVAALAALASLAVLQQWVIGTGNDLFGFSTLKDYVDIGSVTKRFQGPLDDPNFWGRVLVSAVPFACALVLAARGRWKAMAGGAALLVLLGIFLTQSRGAFLAAGAAVVGFAILAGPKVRRYLLLMPVVGVLLLVNPATGPRLATLLDVNKSTEDVVDLSIVYREAAQHAGLAMFADHPLIGVGPGNFNALVPEYVREGVASLPPGAQLGEIAPHNTYLEMSAESGIVGLAAYLFLVGSGMTMAALALRRANRAPDDVPDIARFRAFTAATIAGLFAWSCASVWLHVAQLRTLLVLVSLAAATLPISRGLPQRPAPPRMSGLVRVTEDVIAVAVATLVSGVLLVTLPGADPVWTARARTVVVADTGSDVRDVYMQSFLSRGDRLRSAIAQIADQPAVAAEVRASLAADGVADADQVEFVAVPRRYLLVVEFDATAPALDAAVQGATEFRKQAVASLAGLDQPYRLQLFDAVRGTREVPSRGLVDIAVVALPVLVLLWRVRRTTRLRGRFRREYEDYADKLRRMYEADGEPAT